jgi:phage terminase small subunit
MAWVSAGEKLDIKRRLFCQEYAALGFVNASEAMRKTGNNTKRAGITASEWLAEADVAAYVAELAEARLYDAEIRSDDLIRELKAVAFGQMADFAIIKTVSNKTPEGAEILNREVVFTPFDELPKHKLKALGEVGERRTKYGTIVYAKLQGGKLEAIRQLREIQAKIVPGQPGDVTVNVKSETTKYSLKRKHRRPDSDDQHNDVPKPAGPNPAGPKS